MNNKIFNKIFKFPLKHMDNNSLMVKIIENTTWDESMKARKTASYGKPYNYNNKVYDYIPFPEYIEKIIVQIENNLNYTPNNCLINFYFENSSSMGYHSDDIKILDPNTGITILSLGSERIMKFKNLLSKEIISIPLVPGEFLHMTSQLQSEWKHSVASSSSLEPNIRISLTFRKLRG